MTDWFEFVLPEWVFQLFCNEIQLIPKKTQG